jgi:hypothetical protein
LIFLDSSTRINLLLQIRRMWLFLHRAVHGHGHFIFSLVPEPRSRYLQCANETIRGSEWIGASECALMPTERFFSFIIVRTGYIRWDDDDHFVLDQHASSLKQQSVGRHLDMVLPYQIINWWFGSPYLRSKIDIAHSEDKNKHLLPHMVWYGFLYQIINRRFGSPYLRSKTDTTHCDYKNEHLLPHMVWYGFLYQIINGRFGSPYLRSKTDTTQWLQEWTSAASYGLIWFSIPDN